MIRRNNFNHQIFLWAMVFLLFGGGQAMGEITLPSAVKLEKSIYFQKPGGGTVQVNPGIYEIAQNGEKQLSLDPAGAEGPIAVQAIPAAHNQTLENPTAKFIPSPGNNPDVQHLVLWLPDGLALEAVGSYSGVFTRSTEMWGTEEDVQARGLPGSSDATQDDRLSVVFGKPIFFKTPGGNSKVVQPGEYYVSVLDNGVQLSPAEGKGEPIEVMTEHMGTSAAVVLPDFNNNPDLAAVMIATASGQSLVAIGSHSGVFPRGIWGDIKGAARAVGGAAKFAAKGVYSLHAGVARAAYGAAKYGVQHGRQIAGAAYNAGKGVVTKVCGTVGVGAGSCLKVVGAAAAAVS